MSDRGDPRGGGIAELALLTVDGLETFYDSIQALKGISFQVPEGSIVTLLGANGAGKSTTLKSISGLARPKRGTVTFAGRRIDGLPSEQIVRLGISHVPEGRELFPELTVLENRQCCLNGPAGDVGRARAPCIPKERTQESNDER